MYCRSWGKELADNNAEIWYHCGIKLGNDNKYYHADGAETSLKAQNCIKCDTNLTKLLRVTTTECTGSRRRLVAFNFSRNYHRCSVWYAVFLLLCFTWAGYSMS